MTQEYGQYLKDLNVRKENVPYEIDLSLENYNEYYKINVEV